MTEQKPFQLDPNDFKTGNMIVDGMIKNLVKKANALDLNKNGVSDIAEIMPLLMQLLPILVAINEVVDFEALAEDLVKHPAVKDQEGLKAALRQLAKLAEHASKVLPH